MSVSNKKKQKTVAMKVNVEPKVPQLSTKRSCSSPRAPYTLSMVQDPVSALQGHQPLPLWHCRRTSVQPPTALPCPAMSPARPGLPMGPCPSPTSACSHLQGGQCPRFRLSWCPWLRQWDRPWLPDPALTDPTGAPWCSQYPSRQGASNPSSVLTIQWNISETPLQSEGSESLQLHLTASHKLFYDGGHWLSGRLDKTPPLLRESKSSRFCWLQTCQTPAMINMVPLLCLARFIWNLTLSKMVCYFD